MMKKQILWQSVDVTGQLAEVGSHLPSYGSEIKLGRSDLVASTLTS